MYKILIVFAVIAMLVAGCNYSGRYDNLRNECTYSNGNDQAHITMYHNSGKPYSEQSEMAFQRACKELRGIAKQNS